MKVFFKVYVVVALVFGSVFLKACGSNNSEPLEIPTQPKVTDPKVTEQVQPVEKKFDYQLEIWELVNAGKVAEAEKLKGTLNDLLTFGKYTTDFAAGGTRKKLLLKFKEPVTAIFKTDDKAPRDLTSGYLKEIAAYVVDQLFGFDIVPMTVAREVKGEMGSVQVFVSDVVQGGSKGTLGFYKMQVLDFIIRSLDRHPGNWLTHPEHGLIAIDNGLSFYYDQEPFYEKYPLYTLKKVMRKLKYMPKISNKIETATDVDLTQAMSPYLDEQALADFLKTIHSIQDEIKTSKSHS
jgi:predicted small lipoprotein YifL